MGCDIHSVAIDANGNVIEGGLWADGKDQPFGWRNYGVFGFLANVRNYSSVAPISEPRGLPPEFADYCRDEGDIDLGDHSFSWLSVAELSSFNYNAMMIDRRDNARVKSYREFLGPAFFHDLAELQRIGADRVVFGFDS